MARDLRSPFAGVMPPTSSRRELLRTPLHDAAASGRATLCRAYLAQGMDPSARDIAGKTSGDIAREFGHRSLAKLLDDAVLGKTDSLNGGLKSESVAVTSLTIRELHGLNQNDNAVVTRLIAAKRLSVTDSKGNSPLHIAAIRGNLRLCDRLFSAGADPFQLNKQGQTPSAVAVAKGHEELAGLLQELLIDKELRHQSRASTGPTSRQTEPETMRDVRVRTIVPPIERDESLNFGDLPVLVPALEAALFHGGLQRVEHKTALIHVAAGITLNAGRGEEEVDWQFNVDPPEPLEDFRHPLNLQKPEIETSQSVLPAEDQAVQGNFDDAPVLRGLDSSQEDRLSDAIASLLAEIPEALAVTVRMARRCIAGRLPHDFLFSAVDEDEGVGPAMAATIDRIDTWLRQDSLGMTLDQAQREVRSLNLRHGYLLDLMDVMEGTGGMERAAGMLALGLEQITKSFPTRTAAWRDHRE